MTGGRPPEWPEIAGAYRVEALLHAGEAEIYRVRSRGGAVLAAKRLSTAARQREDLQLRLRFEGEVLLELGGRHHVLRCVDVLDAPTTLLLEYAPCGSLAHRLGSTPPPPAPFQIYLELLDAVRHAHSQGVIHRDLKPSNLLLGADGSLRLADFGVAARRGSRGPLGPGWEEEGIGTLGYAAPEQLLDPAPAAWEAADIYSLGVILYELLTGHLPCETSPGRNVGAIATGDPVRPSAQMPGISPELDAVVLTAMHRDAGHRYANVDELERALRAARELDTNRGPGWIGRNTRRLRSWWTRWRS